MMIAIMMMMKVKMMMMKIVPKVSLTLACPMNLKLFPLDTQVLFKCLNSIFSDEIHSKNSKLSAFALFYILQFQTCHLTIASYGWTANDLIYLWKVKKGYL